MKHFIKHPDIVLQYINASKLERREQVLLAFEAEYDIDRPFEVEWGDHDKYFTYQENLYFYKPQYPAGLENVDNEKLLSQSPHFYEFSSNK